jgi:hypothetical protein
VFHRGSILQQVLAALCEKVGSDYATSYQELPTSAEFLKQSASQGKTSFLQGSEIFSTRLAKEPTKNSDGLVAIAILFSQQHPNLR